jgi:hypothetical protein
LFQCEGKQEGEEIVSNDRETKKPFDHQEFVDLLRKLAQPVDFAELERQGVLSRIGRTAWYRVHNFKALPEHVSRKIIELASDAKGGKVKFEKGLAESAAKLLKKINRENG